MSSFPMPQRRAIALRMVVALGLAGAVALFLGGCGGGRSSSSSSSSSPVGTAQAPHRTAPFETIFEAQTELYNAPGPTLDILKAFGVDEVKVFMPWNSLAPQPLSHSRPNFNASDPAAYAAKSWAPYDRMVQEAAARHTGIDVALEAPAPLWATGPHVPPGTSGAFLGAWRPSAQEFGRFATAVGTRYSGRYKPPGSSSPLPRVSFWSIWNEPNYGQQLAPQATDHSRLEISPVLYRGLLDQAWAALQRTGHGHDRVLIGEIAPRGLTLGNQPGNFSGMVPLRFIRALYCVDKSLQPLSGTAATERGCPADQAGSKSFARDHAGLFQATGLAFHPYPQQYAPNVGTPDGLGVDYADLPQLHALEHTLDGAFAAYGSNRRLPLYDTEFGYQTNPPETIIRAISPKLAAEYSNQAEYMSWRDPRVASWDQYLLADPPTGASSFDTGLELANGTAKQPLYDAFRMPVWLPVTTTASGRALEVWGCARPVRNLAPSHRTRQVVSIQFQPAGKSTFSTIKRVPITDPGGYFDTRVSFPSSGEARLAWSYPHAGTIHSRTVQITLH